MSGYTGQRGVREQGKGFFSVAASVSIYRRQPLAPPFLFPSFPLCPAGLLFLQHPPSKSGQEPDFCFVRTVNSCVQVPKQ